MSDYSKMDVEQLEALNCDLMAERAALLDRQRAVASALDLKLRQRELDADLAALQARHGVKFVAPGGIDADGSVNGQ